ncbi:MAG TPA: hypothetical protein VJ756_17200 [Terriglobales bacterium]|jgi:hypothetical protein|nr:hypothetical protein [Terriglobales bacterium]
MNWRSLTLVFVAITAFAAKPNPNVPVATYLSDVDASQVPYYIQSDGLTGPVNGILGEYDNDHQNVASYLNANTYNHEPPGDWTLDLLSSTLRTMRLTLSSANEIPAGQPGYTVPPNPPFQGTQYLPARFEEICTAVFLDMGTMNQVGQTITCPAIFRFNWSSTNFYRVYMTGSWGGSAPESTWVQIQCNRLGINGFCNDWFIDPIPVTNPDGTTSAGRAIGRLVSLPTHGNGADTNGGDFYITFHVHVTRP